MSGRETWLGGVAGAMFAAGLMRLWIAFINRPFVELTTIYFDPPHEWAEKLLVPASKRHDGETCERCGEPVGLVWWCHDKFLWEKVTGKPKPGGSREPAAGVLCIRCFDAAARKVCPWIEWAPLNLRHLQIDEEELVSAEQRDTKEGRDG